ncbi:MAG: hypothetical protein WB819_01020, partial [Terriglobia bacterium]
SFDNGSNWQPLQLNLPHTAVRDIAVQANQSALAIATHGRGFWVLDNIQPLRELSGKALDAPAFLFTPQAAWFAGGQYDPHAAEYRSGENPPDGASVFYELESAPKTPVTLTFTDTGGKTLATFTSTAKHSGLTAEAGMNRFVWDMHYNPAPGGMPGPRIIPGTYRVTLAMGGTRQTRTFEVKKDPAIAADPGDLQARYALLQKIVDELNMIDETVDRIESREKKLKAILAKNPKDEQTRKALATLETVKGKLVAPQADSYLAILQHPTELEGKLGFLYFVVNGSFARPTRTDYEMWETLRKQTDAQIDKLNQ